jgi:hypothetical protein
MSSQIFISRYSNVNEQSIRLQAGERFRVYPPVINLTEVLNYSRNLELDRTLRFFRSLPTLFFPYTHDPCISDYYFLGVFLFDQVHVQISRVPTALQGDQPTIAVCFLLNIPVHGVYPRLLSI